MKRVLFVDHVSRILGGAEINLVELLAAASGTWEAACACAPGSPLESALETGGQKTFAHSFPDDLNQLRLVGQRPGPERLLAGARSIHTASRRLTDTIRDFQPHAVISCTNKDHLAASLATHKAGLPSLWWINDAFTADFFPPLVRFAFARAARPLATRLIAVSDFARHSLLSLGLPPPQVITIANGIPLERYQAAATGQLHQQLGLSPSTRLVGIVGRFTPWKGQELFLQLAAKCAPDFAEVHFVLIGKAFNEDQPFETRLRQFVENSGLSDRVHFVPFQDDIAPLLADLGALVHASLKPEPFGRVIIEAMAAGVPVLAARAGGVPEIITHNFNGLLAVPADVTDYHQQLSRLLNDHALANQLREAAMRTVGERFSIERVRRQFVQLIEEVA